MAYIKTNWEDLPSEDTPIVSTALQNIEDGIEALQKHIITAYKTGNSTTTTSGTTIPFEAVTTIGNKLTFSAANNSIIVGAGVSFVKLSAQMRHATTTGTNTHFYFSKNGTALTPRAVGRTSANFWYTYNLSPFMVAVEENDVITLTYGYDADAGTTTFHASSTHLTVEVVE